MTQICWWLVNIMSRMLEPEERGVVRGDFAESGETGGQALRGVLGLVVRRQMALWKDWQPWLALLGLVGIAGRLLSEVVRLFDFALFERVRGFSVNPFNLPGRMTVVEDIMYLVCLSLALFAWSWASGFVLGSLSGRAIWLTGALFYLVVNDSDLVLSGGIRWGSPNLPPLPVFILDMVLPSRIVALLLFILPAFWGVNQGLRRRALGVRQTLIVAVVVTILTSLVTWMGGWYQNGFPMRPSLWSLALLSWPVGYMIATASWRRWRGKTSLE